MWTPLFEKLCHFINFCYWFWGVKYIHFLCIVYFLLLITIQVKSKKRLQTLQAYKEGLLHIVDSVKICFLQLLLFNSCCEWKQFICLCGKWWKPTVFVHNYAAYTIVIWVYLNIFLIILKLHIKYVKKWNMKSGEN